MQKSYTEKTYVICHNGSDIIHPVVVEPGTNLATGQPEFEEFSDEEAWKERLQELNYDISTLFPLKGAKDFAPGERAAKLGPEGGKFAKLTPEERKARRAERMALRQAEQAASKKA
jgi:hypothetical protein